MEKKKKIKKKLIVKLRNKYRLVLINDASFDERLSILLTPLNVISIVGLAFFLVSGITIGIIVLTPLKEYIPGFSDAKARQFAFEAARTTDSLEHALSLQQQYLRDFRMVLNGELSFDSVGLLTASHVNYENLNFSTSPEDSLLRKEIESEEAYSLAFDAPVTNRKGMAGVFFFSPIRGTVMSSFDITTGHFGVDVLGPKDESIKSVLDGTVVIASFTTDGGYVIQVQHDHNLVSVYKHNSILLKKVGDKVKAGDNIAIIGNSGELSDGPHLHFELWQSGIPLDPQEFIAFY